MISAPAVGILLPQFAWVVDFSLAAFGLPASGTTAYMFSPAIPIYINTRPYQRIPFQWSLHHNNGNGSLVHADFLAKGESDPRREFSETLLSVSAQFPGVVMVWSSFEANVIRDMLELFPDLAEKLAALLNRTVDLLRIVREHIAHPDFNGSYSMKAVAPALAPDITYSDLDIADGGGASAAFYRLVADPPRCRPKRGTACGSRCYNTVDETPLHWRGCTTG